LTDSLFFDTDCLSAFLWVRNENLLVQLYPGRIAIPRPVYEDLSHPGIAHLKARVDTLLSNKQIAIEDIVTGTATYDLYYQLTETPADGHIIIGKGEAASIALAKANDGIVASNNLRDITSYVEQFSLHHVTTGEILIEAYEKGYITKEDGDSLWASMLAKRRKLGADSFSDYLMSKGKTE
jgi:predicted nucleic acid-binding protein